MLGLQTEDARYVSVGQELFHDLQLLRHVIPTLCLVLLLLAVIFLAGTAGF